MPSTQALKHDLVLLLLLGAIYTKISLYYKSTDAWGYIFELKRKLRSILDLENHTDQLFRGQVRKELREKGPARILPHLHFPGTMHTVVHGPARARPRASNAWARTCSKTQRDPGCSHQQYQGGGNTNKLETQSLSLRYLHSILLTGGFPGGSGRADIDLWSWALPRSGGGRNRVLVIKKWGRRNTQKMLCETFLQLTTSSEIQSRRLKLRKA